MVKEISSKKYLLIISGISTFVFYMLANGQRFFSTSYSGDSLQMIYQNDSAWQIALGRFMQPILVMLRGGIVSPFLISVLSMVWLSLAVWLLADYLELRNGLSVFLTASVMACNSTVVSANSTFLQWADFYALSLLCAVFGVWLLKKDNWLLCGMGIVCLSVSMGIYQSYICVAIALIMIYFMFKLLRGTDFAGMVKSVIKHCLALLIGAGIYYFIWKIFQKVFDIWTANTYNGLASVGDYSDISLGTIVVTAYQNVMQYFWNPDTFVTMPFRGESLSIFWVYLLRVCNLGVAAFIIFGLLQVNLKGRTKWWQRFVQMLLLVMFPLGINFVCVISKGMEHTLMIYAFCLVYVLGIKVAEECAQGLWKEKRLCRAGVPYLAVLAAVMLVSWSNIVYSNQVYLKKDLQEKATYSMMTRIVYEIESLEGYVAGETPVAFLGSFENTSYVQELEGFEELTPYGMGKSSITYTGIEYSYLTYILNTNMNLTRVSDENPVIQEMPVYPAKGSVAMVDGVVVVKISE